jgi:hypothetical protein
MNEVLAFVGHRRLGLIWPDSWPDLQKFRVRGQMTRRSLGSVEKAGHRLQVVPTPFQGATQ